MAYPGLDVINDTSIKGILQYPNISTPSFYPLILFGIFVVVSLATYFSEKERTGRGNFLSSLAVAGVLNIVLSVLLNLMTLISTLTLIVSMVISFIFIAIYLLTK